MMLEEKQERYAHTRRTWAEIDLDAVQHNFQEIKGYLRPGVKVCCVIKADGYGHGAVVLAREYENWERTGSPFPIWRRLWSFAGRASAFRF